MTAKQVITQLYQSKDFKQTCYKVGGCYGDDLQQEITVLLLEMPDEKIMTMHNQGYLKWFVVKMIMRQFRGNRTAFLKKYQHRFEIVCMDGIEVPHIDPDQEELADEQMKIDRLKSAYESLSKSDSFPYEQRLLDLYMRVKNKSEISRLTGIPYQTVRKNLNDIHAKLRAACV